MFQTVELGQKVDKDEYKAQVPALRTALLDLQNQLKSARFSTVIVIGGVEGAGKSETVKVLHEWFDPRFIETHGFEQVSEEEERHPRFWRFWIRLPGHGRIGIFFGSWYTQPIIDRAFDVIGDEQLVAKMREIEEFERALVQDGTLLVKYWFHLSRDAQKARLRKLEKDPEQSYRVTKRDWRHFKRYDEFRVASERALSLTDTDVAPWTLIEGTDKRFRNLAVGRHLKQQLSRALEQHVAARAERKKTLQAEETARLAPTENLVGTGPEKTVLSTLDLSQKADPATYEDELKALQARFGRLCREFSKRELSAVFAFEGWDAAGKGGVIRRIAGGMDARHYSIVPIAAPTDEELAHHYLWRFWRKVARPGRITIFDRSWYGRVLVERVEGFATISEWSRAYNEINDFERQLTAHGTLVLKFWLHIDPDEQLRRFEERQNTPWKQFKITTEDWRNRDKWNAYEQAVHDMVEHTSTHDAPWILVPSNDKGFARLYTLRTICEQMQGRLAE